MMKISSVLLATIVTWNLVQLSSSLSETCNFFVDPGQDEDLNPFRIQCTTFPNGTLHTLWTVTNEYVREIHMDYNCTVLDEEQTGNLYSWVRARTGTDQATRVNLVQSVSGITSVEATCYIDGCYVWDSIRASPLSPTWVIPTATCTFFTLSSPSYSTSIETSAVVSSVMTRTPSTPPNVAPTVPLDTSGGLRSYLSLLILILVLLGILFVIVTFLCIKITIRRRKREWWLYGDIKDKDTLLGNEPCIDPINREKNDYYETITIVDPLDVHERGLCGETPFLLEPNQQADDSDDHSSSDMSDNGSLPLESDRSVQLENDNVSTCTQPVENSESVGVEQCDSEEEILHETTVDSAARVYKGASSNAGPISAIPQVHSPISNRTPRQSSQTHSYPESVLDSKQSEQSPKDKTIDDQCLQRNEPPDEVSSPDYIPSSEYSETSGNGMSLIASSSDNDNKESKSIMRTQNTTNGSAVGSDSCESGSTHTVGKPNDIDSSNAKFESRGTQGQQIETSTDTCGHEEQSRDQELNQDEHLELIPSESHTAAADSIVHKLSELPGSVISESSRTEEEKRVKSLNLDQPHGSHQLQLEHQIRDNYISSSDYTSSVYSSEQGTASRAGNSIVGYLADIEDMDSVSLQSELESDEDAHNGLSERPHISEDENRSVGNHGDIAELSMALSNALPHVHRNVRNRPSHIASDDDQFGLYCAIIPPLSLPDSPSSGYIGDFPLNLPQRHIDNGTRDSDGTTYEDMTQPVEHSDTSHSGYVSINPHTEYNQQVKNYQFETTV